MKKIAIITARGGSKGLPNKNMLMVDGKPLLAYSIEAALEAAVFDKIILTTDSQEYIDFLSSYPIDFIRRADYLATDRTSSFEVLKDVLDRSEYRDCDYFVLLQPTSPLRTQQHIVEACERFEAHFEDFDYLVSVSNAHKPTTLTRQIDEDESLKFFDLDYSRYARQNYAPEYSPNGALFLAKPEAYLVTKQFYGAKCLAYFMGKDVSIDIDDIDDFEYFFSVIQKRKRRELLKAAAERELRLKFVAPPPSHLIKKQNSLAFIGGSLLALYRSNNLGNRSIHNLAVVSITAAWYRELISAYESCLFSPHIILAFGRDELRYPDVDINQVVGDIVEFIEYIQKITPEASIYVLECLKGLFRVDLKNEQVEILNTQLLSKIENLDRVTWIETNRHFTDKYGKLCQCYTKDGLNLTNEGYLKLEEVILSALEDK